MDRSLRNPQRPVWAGFSLSLSLILLLLTAGAVAQQNPLVKISIDRFTNTDSVHATEVEPDTFAWGNTIVSAFHVARRPGSIGWGSGDVGFATSTDAGLHWKFGYLPGLTINYKNGTYGAAADPSVALDANTASGLSTLPLAGLNGGSGLIGDVAVSRSTDGLHWGNPITIDGTHLDDKNWTVCDNTTTSPFYGNCYTQWDQAFGTGDILMSVSSDGGQSWGPGKASADQAGGLGGQPLVQPNGTVIVPFEGFGIQSIRSTDGGKTWARSVTIANINEHLVAGGMRNPNLPGAEIDGAGKVYVVWSDCRFRTGCKSNDIVMSTSTDGQTWAAPVRIPIDPVTSTVDHFIPGIGIDPNTSGSTANLTVVYYFYPQAGCSANCQLSVGFVNSADGGQTWSAGAETCWSNKLSWLPNSDNGPMVADYISVSYTNGNPFAVFAVAKAPTGAVLDEAMYTTKNPLAVAADERDSVQRPIFRFRERSSDYNRKAYYDDEGRRPIPELKRPKN